MARRDETASAVAIVATVLWAVTSTRAPGSTPTAASAPAIAAARAQLRPAPQPVAAVGERQRVGIGVRQPLELRPEPLVIPLEARMSLVFR